MAKLKNHYVPTPSQSARRHAFHHLDQAERESVNQYVVELRTASLHCDFKELDDVLLDRLICGLKVLHIQRRLLAKPDLTLQSALDEACAAELSNKSMVEIHGASSPAAGRKALAVHQEEAIDGDVELTGNDDIHQFKTASGNKWPINKTPPSQTCIGCGGNHPRAACRFKTTNCQLCGKRGHLARMCRAILPDDRVQARPVPTKGTRRKFLKLGEDCFTIQRDNYPINPRIGPTNLSIKRKKFLTVNIEGQNCQTEVDTWSSPSLVSWSTIKRLVPEMSKKRLRPCSLKLRDYQGNTIPILGSSKVAVEFKQFKGRRQVIVVEGTLPSLLGLDWFDSLGLAIKRTKIPCKLKPGLLYQYCTTKQTYQRLPQCHQYSGSQQRFRSRLLKPQQQ
ncbi:hypothetical protein E2320_010735 [Naja naja]|nr:hypothetical protein E2320_010735 [Naja naja]